MTAQKRIVELQRLSSDRSRAALARERVSRISERLAEQWDIKFYEAGDLGSHLSRASTDPDITAYWKAYDSVADALKRGAKRTVVDQIEGALYAAIAAPSVFGPVTSQRRALILDSIAFCIGLVEHLDISGPLLDVGCHTGFVANALANELPNSITGIDPSSASIAAGQRHPSRNARVTLELASLPWVSDSRFELLIAIDSMPLEPAMAAQFLRGVSAKLSDGGVALLTSMHWINAKVDRMRAQLKAAGLSFGYADVAGGYMGLPPQFEAEIVVVLVKGGDSRYPRRISEEAEAHWAKFRSYANDPRTLRSEKTQAFHRAIR